MSHSVSICLQERGGGGGHSFILSFGPPPLANFSVRAWIYPMTVGRKEADQNKAKIEKMKELSFNVAALSIFGLGSISIPELFPYTLAPCHMCAGHVIVYNAILCHKYVIVNKVYFDEKSIIFHLRRRFSLLCRRTWTLIFR